MSDYPNPTTEAGPQTLPDPEISFLNHSALLTLPPEWRAPFVLAGRALYEMALERFGIAPAAPDSIATTCRQLDALATELRTIGEQLWEIAAEPHYSDLGQAETRLCKLAGKLAPKIGEISQDLAKAAVGPAPGDDSDKAGT